mmetsp:Transcript_24589/g.53236  ORF Transcript_24589/g.53236 Transcript_24589/m.53236 type:complete len:111 (+) Transcript_24589:528-860(+)
MSHRAGLVRAAHSSTFLQCLRASLVATCARLPPLVSKHTALGANWKCPALASNSTLTSATHVLTIKTYIAGKNDQSSPASDNACSMEGRQGFYLPRPWLTLHHTGTTRVH